MDEQRGIELSQVHSRREQMEDGKRYIIYYTFGTGDNKEPEDIKPETEKPENV